MTFRIPLIPVPSQSLSVNLAGQQCEIRVDQKSAGVFFSMVVDSKSVVSFKMCRDRVSLVRGAHLPFVGTVAFVDTQGLNDPDYTGFGSRFHLVYVP